MARRVLGNLVLVVVATALVLCVLELGMRVARLGRGGGKEQLEVLRYHEYDPLQSLIYSIASRPRSAVALLSL